jgi:hypothetical protein
MSNVIFKVCFKTATVINMYKNLQFLWKPNTSIDYRTYKPMQLDSILGQLNPYET